MVKLFRTHRFTNRKEKINLIYTAYGSLTDFSHRLNISYAMISRQCGIKPETVGYILRRFRDEYDLNLDYFLVGKEHKRRGKPCIIEQASVIGKYLVSEKCLREWLHLSLPQRVAKIKHIYNIQMSSRALGNFYVRCGVKQQPAYGKLYPNRKDPLKLEAERIEFAMRMSEWITEGRHVIYFDETTFSPDMHQKKVWYHRGVRFPMPIRKQAMTKDSKYGFTVYGAVSQCIKNGGFFEVHESSNRDDFCGFMKRLKKRVRTLPGEQKPICVLDNLSAHKGPDRREIMNKFCKSEFIPTYSCELNAPIETLWAILKRRVAPRFTKLIIRGKANKKKLKALVKDELHNKIDKQIYANILRAHYPYIQQLLTKAGKDYRFGSGRQWED